MSDPSWAGLDTLERDTSAAAASHKELGRAYVRAFTGNNGEAVLDALKALTVDRVLPATATDAELRYLEGQRALFRHILREIERGTHE